MSFHPTAYVLSEARSDPICERLRGCCARVGFKVIDMSINQLPEFSITDRLKSKFIGVDDSSGVKIVFNRWWSGFPDLNNSKLSRRDLAFAKSQWLSTLVPLVHSLADEIWNPPKPNAINGGALDPIVVRSQLRALGIATVDEIFAYSIIEIKDILTKYKQLYIRLKDGSSSTVENTDQVLELRARNEIAYPVVLVPCEENKFYSCVIGNDVYTRERDRYEHCKNSDAHFLIQTMRSLELRWGSAIYYRDPMRLVSVLPYIPSDFAEFIAAPIERALDNYLNL